MSLADKMIKEDIDYYGDWYKADDVKQALKELIAKSEEATKGLFYLTMIDIKEIFGKELLE